MPGQDEDEEILRLLEGDAPTPPPASRAAASPLLYFLKKLTGNDLVCVFGDTGSGKSKMVSELAIDEQKTGGKVVYFDTEQGFSENVVQRIKNSGIDYRRIGGMRDVYSSLRRLDATLVVIDSSTLFITGRWFAEQLDAKGRLLQELQYTYYLLKDWCQRKKAMAVVIAQPVSDFGGKGLNIMGDKANFYLKDSLYIDFEREQFTVKKRLLRVFKSRTLPEGMVICKLKTTATGMVHEPINTEALKLLKLQ